MTFISKKSHLAMTLSAAENIALAPNLYERHMVETAYKILQRATADIGEILRQYRDPSDRAYAATTRDRMRALMRAERACRKELRS